MSVLSQFYPSGGGVGSPVPSDCKVIEFLIVGGGGGSSQYPAPFNTGGTGGGGEMLEGKNIIVTNGTTYNITVGSGGVGSPAGGSTNGGYSSFGDIVSGGGHKGLSVTSSGGSAGGIRSSPINIFTSSIPINKTNFISHQFNLISTINSYSSTNSDVYGGGAGGDSRYPDPVPGRSNSITGSSESYAAGGILSPTPIPPSGSNTGNGGSATPISTTTATLSPGGSGIVVLRWPTAFPAASSVTGNTPTPAQPGYHVYRWNGDGSITF